MSEQVISCPPKLGPMVQAERIVRTCSHCAEAQPIDAGRAVPFGRICCASLALRAPVRSRALRGCNPTVFEYKDLQSEISAL